MILLFIGMVSLIGMWVSFTGAIECNDSRVGTGLMLLIIPQLFLIGYGIAQLLGVV